MRKRFAQLGGFTLLELLLSLSAGLILIGLALVLFIKAKNVYGFANTLARLQENAQLTAFYLRKDFHLAGFIGCPRLSDVLPSGATARHFLSATRVVGFSHDKTSASFALPPLSANRLADSAVVIIQSRDAHGFAVQTASLQQIVTVSPVEVKAHEWLMIADCEHADIVQVAHVQRHIITLTTTLQHVYGNSAEIGQLHQWVYYVAATLRKTARGDKILALYRRDMLAPPTLPTELIEGISKLNFYYGTGQNVAHYVEATHVADWRKVNSVKTVLLLVSTADGYRHSLLAPVLNTYALSPQSLQKTWTFFTSLREQ